jgi:hypothetical protein
MILVTGSILAREDAFDEVLRSCIEHVERSRKEPGCISHDVHVDCQNPRAAATAKKMMALGINSSTLKAPAMRGPPTWAATPAVTMPMKNSTAWISQMAMV